MPAIRAFEKVDIPKVSEMFRRLLLGDEPSRRSLPLSALQDYFSQIFFHSPWYDPAIPSLVYQDDEGKIIGFLGVVPRRMIFQNNPITVAISFHFMVEPESRSSLAGIHLLKTFFSGPQDISLTDGAGDVGRKVWEMVGGVTVPLYSQRWMRILRPSRQALGLLSRNKLISTVSALISPLADFTDSTIAHFMPRYFPSANGAEEEELNVETFLKELPQFSRGLAIQPCYDEDTAQWVFDNAAQMKYYGRLYKILVRNAKKEVNGWFIYYLKEGDTGIVLQLAARKGAIAEVLDHLFWHAKRKGAAAVSGRAIPRYSRELSEKHCFFQSLGGYFLIQSRNAELLHAIQRGDAFMSMLEGELVLLF
ncbi:MAG: hypothetical protein J2P41_09105 [Blastocatellia bacterium]|nr:hypothetical protein [Blastocatellia bacterium]